MRSVSSRLSSLGGRLGGWHRSNRGLPRREAGMRVCAGLLNALLNSSCQASLEAEARAGNTAEVDAQVTDLRGQGPEIPPELVSASAGEVQGALLGARPDLSFKGPPTALCECLETALGAAGAQAFSWDRDVAVLDPARQLAFAMRSRGVACDRPSPLGASYQGYVIRGSDVVILVEAAVEGRPVVEGALIPRPTQGGSVYVEPADPGLPYGRGTSGQPRCALGPQDS